jgi:phosphoglucan,water dikinase
VIGVSAAESLPAIRQVWASLWNRRAFLSRQQNRIPDDRIHMAVLVQELLDPELSFVMHTVDPMTGDRDQCQVELVVGLGETLVSASQPGNAYRLICNRRSGKTELTACASFSMALRPGSGNGIEHSRINYTQIPLSADPRYARSIGEKLGKIASVLEQSFGAPQDAEGVVIGDQIYLLQSRPQQGV